MPSLSYSVTGHSILVSVDSAPVTSMTATALATFASSAAGPCTVMVLTGEVGLPARQPSAGVPVTFTSTGMSFVSTLSTRTCTLDGEMYSTSRPERLTVTETGRSYSFASVRPEISTDAAIWLALMSPSVLLGPRSVIFTVESAPSISERPVCCWSTAAPLMRTGMLSNVRGRSGLSMSMTTAHRTTDSSSESRRSEISCFFRMFFICLRLPSTYHESRQGGSFPAFRCRAARFRAACAAYRGTDGA